MSGFIRRGIHGAYVYYLAICLLLLVAALLTRYIENYFLTLFLGISALAALYGLWANRHFSFASIIPRKQIEEIIYQPAIQGVSRATFLILFRPNKRLFKRKLTLPTATYQGTSLADTAYWMLKEEGLIKE